jgi:hypothetical protein
MQKMTTRLNANMDTLMTQVENDLNNVADQSVDALFASLIGEDGGSDDEYMMDG